MRLGEDERSCESEHTHRKTLKSFTPTALSSLTLSLSLLSPSLPFPSSFTPSSSPSSLLIPPQPRASSVSTGLAMEQDVMASSEWITVTRRKTLPHPTARSARWFSVSLHMYIVHALLCLALPCLCYRKFEPGRLGCLGSSVGRALD